MNAKRLQKQINALEAQAELSQTESKKLRNMKAALLELTERADKKGKAYGDVPAAHHSGPVEKYLDGAAWLHFFNKYCDPKGIAQAKASEVPQSAKAGKREREGQPGQFSFNGKTVAFTREIPRNRFVKTSIVNSPFDPTAVVKTSRKRTKSERSGNSADRNVVPGFGMGLSRALELLDLFDAGKLVGRDRLVAKIPLLRQNVQAMTASA